MVADLSDDHEETLGEYGERMRAKYTPEYALALLKSMPAVHTYVRGDRG